MQGWIKLHRKLVEWEWYHDTNVKVLFIHLLLLANHSEQKWKGNIIKRGQLITSSKHLSEGLNMSRQKVRTALQKLERTNEIRIKATNKYTLITIENYDKFQSDEEKSNQQITIKQPINNQQITTNKNEKKYKNENNKFVVEKFYKPTIDEIRKYIIEKDYNIDAEYFYNYYEANGWKVGKNSMKSWKACLVTWQKKNEKEKKCIKPNHVKYEQRKYDKLDSLYCNMMKEF